MDPKENGRAQRAWDAERVQSKRGHATSEPEDFLRLALWKMMQPFIGF